MSTGDLNFHIGDKVVYPNHGVGIIEQISSRATGATVEKFYLLTIKASSLKVMIPFNNVGNVGLRRVVRNGEIQKVLDLLSVGENGSNGDWTCHQDGGKGHREGYEGWSKGHSQRRQGFNQRHRERGQDHR